MQRRGVLVAPLLLVQLLLLLLLTPQSLVPLVVASAASLAPSIGTHAIVPASHARNVTMCYLFFGAISDLGWTFSYNQGRLAVHEQLKAEFPTRTFASQYVENVGTMTPTQVQRILDDFLTNCSCNVILHNSNAILDLNTSKDYADRYQNASFILLNEYEIANLTLARQHPNLALVANDYTAGYLIAGAAAGAQAQRCIAFLAAWSVELDPTNAFAGFLLGVRRSNPTIPVHVVAEQSWFDPTADTILANVFLDELKCDVIGRYSDPFTVDIVVHQSALDGVFTVSPHSDLQMYVGDSILASISIDWSVSIMQTMRELLVDGRFNQSYVHFFGYADRAITVSPVSPHANAGAAAAMASATAFVTSRPNNQIIPGSVILANGSTLFPGGAGFKEPWMNMGQFIIDAYVTVHPPFQQPTNCPAGTFYQYTETPHVSLLCSPCAAGTYAAYPGSSQCTPCPEGSTSTASRQSCVASTRTSVGLVVGLSFTGFTLAAVLIIGYHIYRDFRARHRFAPRKAPVALVFLNVEAHRALFEDAAAPDAKGILRTYVSNVNAVLERSDAYLVRHAGTSFVIACPTAYDGVAVALELQETLHLHTWPQSVRDLGGLKPRIAVHLCERADVVFSFSTMSYDYIGPEVVLAQCIASVSIGGFIVCSERTMIAAESDPDYALVLQHEISSRQWGDARRLEEVIPNRLSNEAADLRLELVISKHIERLASEARTQVVSPLAATQLPDGADPLLHQSASSSNDSYDWSVTSYRHALSATHVALALMAVFHSVEVKSDVTSKDDVIRRLGILYELDPTQISSRRVAAGIANKLFATASPPSPVQGQSGAESDSHSQGVRTESASAAAALPSVPSAGRITDIPAANPLIAACNVPHTQIAPHPSGMLYSPSSSSNQAELRIGESNSVVDVPVIQYPADDHSDM